MIISSVKYTGENSFLVNDALSVPDDMLNRHRRKVQTWIDAGNTPEPYVAPEKTWLDKRLANINDGGYGTTPEQLEMIGEQGMTVYQAHIQTVKTNNPKTV